MTSFDLLVPLIAAVVVVGGYLVLRHFRPDKHDPAPVRDQADDKKELRGT